MASQAILLATLLAGEIPQNLRLLRADPEEEGAEAGPPRDDDESFPLEDCLVRFWEAGEGLASAAGASGGAEASDALLRQLDPPPLGARGRDLVELLSRLTGRWRRGQAGRRAMGAE